ncbi:pyridoxal-phosphate dependent enzyme [Corynebacterium pacaense]|uniref:pyridoxal-phosphate dependent enzyme n=1 Tax=Corynebacterium pacaense TaxID=1816684 RepID=UPI0009BB468A|nr:pyridoxal-phosphate dependent enzyme [Corynebacterium pacaense]
MTSGRGKPVAGITGAVGNTPLVRLARLSDRDDILIWAKLEEFNPGGSAKDRTALAMIDAALSDGSMTAKTSIVESSSGNLGVALARECLLHGWAFHCVVDPRVNRRTVALMSAFGATIHRVTAPDPKTGDWLIARRAMVRELLMEIPDSVSFDQYSNPAAFTAHAAGTMSEIVSDLGHAPDLLFVAMSTTGTIGGCARHLASIGARTLAIGVDAEGSVLFGGSRGTRVLPGFGAGVAPELEKNAHPHEVVRVADTASVVGARALVHREGVLAGASGGAVVAALMERIGDFAPGTEVVLVLHDSGASYLETIYDDAWVEENLGMCAGELRRREELMT